MNIVVLNIILKYNASLAFNNLMSHLKHFTQKSTGRDCLTWIYRPTRYIGHSLYISNVVYHTPDWPLPSRYFFSNGHYPFTQALGSDHFMMRRFCHTCSADIMHKQKEIAGWTSLDPQCGKVGEYNVN